MITITDQGVRLARRIKERSLHSSTGQFWNVTRPGGTAVASDKLSLAFGNWGILAALGAHVRMELDSPLRQLLSSNHAWCRAKEKEEDSGSFAHGCYTGHPSRWLARQQVCDLVPEAQAELAASLEAWLATELNLSVLTTTALAQGVAGTMLALLALPEAESMRGRERLRQLFAAIVRAAQFSAAGVYWDRFANSRRPCLGFVNGNAGIDYALALAGRHLRIDCAPLLLASIRHSNAEFDAENGNWPDFESNAPESEAKDSARARAKSPGDCTDSVSWGTGVAGVLLSRAVVMGTTEHESLRALCLADCERALARLARYLEADAKEMDLSMYRGLGGVLLCLHQVREFYPPADACFEVARRRYLEALADADARTTDCGVFSGWGGMLLAVTESETGTTGVSGIAPALARYSAARHGEPLAALSLHELYQARLPRHCAAGGFLTAATRAMPLDLQSLQRLRAEIIQADLPNLQQEALRHEFGMHELAAAQAMDFLSLTRESERTRDAGILFRDPDRRVALYAIFQLAPTVELLTLPFDPEAPLAAIVDQPTPVVRFTTSRGVAEQKISSLVYHLLAEFRVAQTALEGFGKVTARVRCEADKLPKVAEVCFEYLRHFATMGVLMTTPPNRLTLLAVNPFKLRLRRKLFPRL